MGRLTKEEWIAKARSVHGDRYDYSRVEYKGQEYNVIIGCDIHGWFSQNAASHTNAGCGCNDCAIIYRAKKKNMTTSQFITRAREIHGDKYDYSRSIYTKARKNLIIGCRECGSWFPQTPMSHTHGTKAHGCPDCGRKKAHANRSRESYQLDPLISQDEFIFRLKAIFEGTIDTSMTIFTGVKNDVKIRCVRCDLIYEQNGARLLSGKQGCKECRYKRTSESQIKTTAQWVIEAIGIHGNDFDYSEVEYAGKEERVIITCNTCQTRFHPQANVHLSGKGSCPECRYVKSSESKRIPMREILDRCIEVHGDRYEYPWDESEYKNSTTEMPIVCRKHGEFSMRPVNHYGREQGCVKCLKKTQTKLFEFIQRILPGHKVRYDFKHHEMRFSKSNHPMEIDIWIPELQLGIEYQGELHFFEHWSHRNASDTRHHDTLSAVQERDEEKRVACKQQGITLLEIDFTWDRKIDSIKDLLSNMGIC